MVYQVGNLGDDQGWRTVHQCLQRALKSQMALRKTQLAYREHLKISLAQIQQRETTNLYGFPW